MSGKLNSLKKSIAVTGLYALLAISGPSSPPSLTHEPTAEDIFRAIREDNAPELRHLVSAATANIANGQKATPLHYAALYGSPESIRLLLSAGADPNARDLQDSTALTYAAYDTEKTRLLVEHGAEVNVRNHVGASPLIVASSTGNNSATVKYLIERGAKADDEVDQGRALTNAAFFGDEESVRTLLAHGASPRRADRGGFTALLGAMNSPLDERVRLLLAAGSDVDARNSFAGMVKNGPISLVHLTPLMLAAPYAKPEVVQALLQSGAHINFLDVRQMNALMFAVATDFANPETVRCLIRAGADVNQIDRNGESVLDWALKFGNPEIIAELRQAGARESQKPAPPLRPDGYRPENVTSALAKSRGLLLTSGKKFFAEGGGCWGCHHQPIDARAYAASHDAGLLVDEPLKRVLLDSVIAGRPKSFRFYPVLMDTGGDIDPVLSALTALADLHEPPTPDTDVMVHYIAARQRASGTWSEAGIARPPIEESDITRTASAIRVLSVYGWPARSAEFQKRIERGREWLLAATARTTYERADLLMGLFYTNAPQSAVQKAGASLLEQQRPDGGWAQTSFLGSDAYATGMALHALHTAGILRPSDQRYLRGVGYLLATQFPDGSWYVRSRAPKFQPYFQSGFPFNHDQWISSTATGWAAMALAPAAALEQHNATFKSQRQQLAVVPKQNF